MSTAQPDLNSVTIVGRTGQDPELKYFESGSVKVSFSLAVNRGGSQHKETDWFNIEAWGRTAEVVGEYLKKGREAAVHGKLAVRSYKDDAGNEREFLSVVATDVKFLGSKRENEGGSPQQSGGY
jgi:single-strand DNA-binding protein